MQGDKSCPGIIPRAIDDIFTYIKNVPYFHLNQVVDLRCHVYILRQSSDREFLMRISYMEIYNENLCDLLNPQAVELKVSEHYEVHKHSSFFLFCG